MLIMLLPKVLAIQHDGDLAVTLNLHISEHLDFFPGHFPGHPILPGVVQLHWAIHYGGELLPMVGSFVRMDNIKFNAIVLPNANMDLSLQWHSDKTHLEFIFSDHVKKFSSGRVVFGGLA
jgi:3-hydroxymyristoyl/3-hydroxydecanoyl-(acyl carrier protein) dehydratase